MQTAHNKAALVIVFLIALFFGGFKAGEYHQWNNDKATVSSLTLDRYAALQGCELVAHQALLDQRQAEQEGYECMYRTKAILNLLNVVPAAPVDEQLEEEYEDDEDVE
jgi:hypothetical protein